MFPLARLIATLLLFAATGSLAYAQTAQWSPDSGTIQRGKRYSINLEFSGCSPDGQPPADLSADGIQVHIGGGIQSITSGFFGRAQTSIQYSYQITATRLGRVEIPAFDVQTDRGVVTVAPARFEVVEASVGNTGIKPDEVLLSRFQVADERIYQGEVFTLDYLAGAKQFRVADLGAIEWEPTGIVTSGLEAVEKGAYPLDGDTYNAVRYSTQALATQSGSLNLGPLSQPIMLVVGQRNRSSFFPETYTEEYRLESEPFALEALPLPAGAPDSFTGAVGRFELEARAVPENVRVGEPITWTLRLSGTGNWPSGIGVPSRKVSSSFRAIQPEVRNEFEPNSLFNGSQSEDIVLIPTAAGEYQLGPIDFSFFDPQAERYESIRIPATRVQVAAAAGRDASSGSAGAEPGSERPESDEAESVSWMPRGEDAASRPPALPKEPADGLDAMPLPSELHEPLRLALLGLCVPLGLWLGLALARTVTLDPSRKRRAAYAALKARQTQPLPEDSEALRQQQYAWRRDARVYWDIASSEPSAEELAAAVRRRTDEATSEKWETLWRESDRILFSGRQVDAQRWSTLFRDAMQVSPRPRRDYSTLFSRPVWLGAIGLGLLAGLPERLEAQEDRASDARTYYLAGDFANAEREWRALVSEQPAAWQPRYNAGLAAAQQEQWGRAWAYWASAFCLNPRDERIAWNLRIAQSRTQAYDPILRDLLEGNGLFALVAWQSPGQWQRLGRWMIFAASAALCLAALARYNSRIRRSALPLLCLGVLLALSAAFAEWARSKYGYLASPSTELLAEQGQLRSIPADLGPSQLETTVTEGSAALVVTKRYLGWSKIRLPNEEEGWIRSESLVPLYGPIPQLPQR